MAKRFTDTQIWEKEWFMALSPRLKCLWRYLTERCDQAGVWEPNWQLATIYIGETVSVQDLKAFGHHVEILETGKIFIPDFINFQYGRLSESSPAHNPVFRAIEKNRLSNRVFNRVSNTLKEKEKEEDKDKEEEKETLSEREKIKNNIFSDELFLETLQRDYKGKDWQRGFVECWNYHTQKGAVFEDWEWRRKLLSWLGRMKSNGHRKNEGKIQ